MRSLRGTKEHSEFQATAKQLPYPASDTFLDSLQQEAAEEVNRIDKLLASHYLEINEAFEKLRNRKYDPPWHAPCGAASIRQVANDLKLLFEYETTYSSLSRFAHANYLRKHVSLRPDLIVFQPIRHLESIDFVLNIVLSVAFRTYRNVLNQYRSGEVENFKRKYTQDWRKAFLEIPTVKYKESVQKRP